MLSATHGPRLSRRDALRSLGLFGAAAAFAPALLRGATPTPPPTAAANPLPSLTGAQPGYYRFKIGALHALALCDGGAAFPLSAAWPLDARGDDLTRTLQDASLATDQVNLPFNVLLVKIGSELLLVDAGCGAAFGPAGGRLVASLAAAGVKPEQVTGVILTHAHGDHFGGLIDPTTKDALFRNARHFINRTEHDFWTGSPDLSAQPLSEDDRKGFIQMAQSTLGALKSRWQFIRPGDKLVDGLEIVDAPGHTPGHIALLFSSGRDQLLHVVDAVHHHEISFRHPEATFFGDTNPQAAGATRRRLLDRAAADRLRIYGAHLPFPGLGRVRAEKTNFEYRIEPWVV